MKKATTKWKIGDLVTLSAAGKTVDQNHALLESKGHKRVCLGFGMVIHIKEAYERWPVQVQWFHGRRRSICFKDYELKKFKAPK